MGKKKSASATSGADAMDRISVDIEVANYGDLVEHRRGDLPAERIRRLKMQGVVGPRTMNTVLPEQVAKQLGLTVVGKVGVTHGGKRSGFRDQVDAVYLTIQGRSGIVTAILDKDRDTALIGAIVLTTLDFVVDLEKQRLVPRDPDYKTTEIG
jgi:hypothetical protein